MFTSIFIHIVRTIVWILKLPAYWFCWILLGIIITFLMLIDVDALDLLAEVLEERKKKKNKVEFDNVDDE